ncbi:hypothetical protein C4J81_18700 (plasmid) [Deltaproteobacteria bacterium Smac51]|nr:hypothetical protein C4J81_18700 [Deltaproteobacteria bacterium Smac51]
MGPQYFFGRPCPVCGSAGGRALGRLSFAVFDQSPLDGDFTLAACPACGLAFYDFAAGDDSFSHYYCRNDYYSTTASPGSGGDSEFDRQHQHGIIERLAPWLTSAGPAPIMEIGCGCGGLLSALRDKGFINLYGVDLSPSSIAATLAGGLTAAVGPAEALPFPGLAPRLLIYSHVFEHLPAPLAALAEARRRLAPGGAVYIEVPDAENYGGGGAPFQDFYLEHVSHFSQTSLAALLTSAGFGIMALSRADFHLPGGRVQKVIWAVAAPTDYTDNTHFKHNTIITQNTDTATNVPYTLNTHYPYNTHNTYLAPVTLSAPETVFEALGRYLQWSRNHPAILRLERLAEEQRPVFIWGLSQLIMFLLGSTPLGRCNLRGFIDRDPFKQTRRLLGRAVLPPESLAEAAPGDLVLLAAWGQEEAQRQYLSQIGFQGRAENLLRV